MVYCYRFIISAFLALLVVIGCSSGDHGVFFAINDLPSEGHAVLSAGTFEIDLSNNQVRDVVDNVDPLHNSLNRFLAGFLKCTIIETSPLKLKMELLNPTNRQLYDMRIIYIDLYGKEIMNPDGYTNFYDLIFQPGLKPFTYFAKEYPNQAFPAGPTGVDNEVVELSFPEEANPRIAYIIEASINGNTREPYKIHNILASGNLTRTGGAMIISCDVEDWQNDIDSVTILANDFFNEDESMFRYQGTNKFYGYLINFHSLVPGNYKTWIQAKSKDEDQLELVMPLSIDILATGMNAPSFAEKPHAYPHKYIDESNNLLEVGLSSGIGYSNPYNFLWEQISPSVPQGSFGTTGNHVSNAQWKSPQINGYGEFLFKLDVTPKYVSQKASQAIVRFSTEPRYPVIISGPDVDPNPINENTWATFHIEAYDPEPSDYPIGLEYYWHVSCEGEGTCGEFGEDSNYGQNVQWMAPEVDTDTKATVIISVDKFWGGIGLDVEKSVEILIKNVD